jgi:hypothetical protein
LIFIMVFNSYARKVGAFCMVLAVLFIISACSNTPNSVNISVTPGSCVQPSAYASGITPPTAIANNPSTAPYCAAVTVQNNNSGTNANSIQITSSGLVVSYTPVASNGASPQSAKMCDNVSSSGVCSQSGGVGNLGNVNLYDPNNCVIPQGINVVTLNTGGGSCTFYIQLSGSQYAVGSYPINLAYSYTNGNSNYTINASVNQNVNLFAGGGSGLFQYSSGAWQNTGLSGAPSSGVSTMTTDIYGNLYFNGGGTNVYIYNGNTVTQLGSALPSNVQALAVDQSNHLYAATAGNGVYVYILNSSGAAWSQLSDSNNLITASSNIINLAYNLDSTNNSNVLFASTATTAYQCSSAINSQGTISYACADVSQVSGAPTAFNSGSLAINNQDNQSFWGSSTTAYSFVPSPQAWTPYTGLSSPVYGILYASNFLYLGEVGGSTNSVYTCNLSGGATSCTSIISSANNPVTGNAYSIVIDGANNLYVVGNNLNSTDFSSTATNVSGAHLQIAPGTTSVSTWSPITLGSGVSITSPLVVANVFSVLAN